MKVEYRKPSLFEPLESRKLLTGSLLGGDNLVVNAGFEVDRAVGVGFPDSWGGSSFAALDSTDSHTGGASLRLWGNGSAATTHQVITLQPSTKYVLTAWVKARSVTHATGVSIRYVETSPSTITYESADRVTAGTNGWVQLSRVFTTSANISAGRVEVAWTLNSGDEARIDNLVLARAGTDATAPSAASNLQAAQVSNDRVRLTWTAGSDASNRVMYQVYRDNKLIGSTFDTTLTDLRVTPSTAYVYKVTALDANGNASSPTANLNVTTSANRTGFWSDQDLATYNLLLNPGFETSNGGTGAANWTMRTNTVRDTTVARTGVASYKVTGPNNTYSPTSPAMTLTAGATYRFSAWIKTNAVTSGVGATVRLVQTTPSTKTWTGTYAKETTAWQYVSVDATIPTDYTGGRVELQYDIPTGATVWYDDAYLGVPTIPLYWNDQGGTLGLAAAQIANGATFEYAMPENVEVLAVFKNGVRLTEGSQYQVLHEAGVVRFLQKPTAGDGLAFAIRPLNGGNQLRVDPNQFRFFLWSSSGSIAHWSGTAFSGFTAPGVSYATIAAESNARLSTTSLPASVTQTSNTAVNVSATAPGYYSLRLVDASRNVIRSLAEYAKLPAAGVLATTYDGLNDNRVPVTAGTYYWMVERQTTNSDSIQQGYTAPTGATWMWANGSGLNFVIKNGSTWQLQRTDFGLKPLGGAVTLPVTTFGGIVESRHERVMFVYDSSAGQIKKIDGNGALITDFGTSGVLSSIGTSGAYLALDETGATPYLYVSQVSTNKLRKLTWTGAAVTGFGSSGEVGSPTFTSPGAIWVNADGSLLVGDRAANASVVALSSSGATVDRFRKWRGTGYTWRMMVEDAEEGYSFLRSIATETGVTANTTLRKVNAIRVDANGDIYLTCGYQGEPNREIQVYNAAGEFLHDIGRGTDTAPSPHTNDYVKTWNTSRSDPYAKGDIQGFDLVNGDVMLLATKLNRVDVVHRDVEIVFKQVTMSGTAATPPAPTNVAASGALFAALPTGFSLTDLSSNHGLSATVADYLDLSTDWPGRGVRDDGTSGLVTNGSMTYRLSGADHASFFRAKMQVATPGRPHLLLVEYPDDVHRWTMMSVRHDGEWVASTGIDWLGVEGGYATGWGLPITGSWQQYSTIVTPRRPTMSLYFSSFQHGGYPNAKTQTPYAEVSPLWGATARRVWLLELNPALPSNAVEEPDLASGAPRSVGLHEQNANTVFADFGGVTPGWGSTYRRTNAPTVPTWMNTALGNASTYYNYLGLNYLDQIVIDENGTTTYPSTVANRSFSGTVDLAQLKFDADSSNTRLFRTSIFSFNNPPASRTELTGKGQMKNDGTVSTRYLSIIYPEVQQFYKDWMVEIATRYQGEPNYQGITLLMNGSHSPLWVDNHGYEDASINAFQTATGLTVQGTTTAQKASYIETNYGTQWANWRSDVVKAFVQSARDAIRTVRSDLDLFLQPTVFVRSPEWHGFKASLYAGMNGVIVTQSPGNDQWPGFYQPYDNKWNGITPGAQTPSVEWNHGYFETRTTWPEQTAGSLAPNASLINGPFIAGFIRTNPQLMTLHAWDRGTEGMDLALRQYIRAFRSLPYAPATDITTTAVPSAMQSSVRAYRYGDSGEVQYVAAVNMTNAAKTLTLTIDGSTGLNSVRDLVAGATVTSSKSGNNVSFSVTLPAYSMRSYRIGETGLQANWRFDEGSGTATKNSVNGVNATMTNGPTFTMTTRRVGAHAMNLDGVDDFVETPTDFSFSGWSNYSLAAWVKTDDPNKRQFIYGNKSGLTFELYQGKLYVRMRGHTGGSATWYTFNAGTITNGWHHVAFVFKSGNSATLYVDGVQAGQSLANYTYQPSGTTNDRIGSDPSGGSFFDGVIDDLRIYNRALTTAELSRLAQTTIDTGTMSMFAPGSEASSTNSQPNVTNTASAQTKSTNDSSTSSTLSADGSMVQMSALAGGLVDTGGVRPTLAGAQGDNRDYPNLVYNPGFEYDTDANSKPDDWNTNWDTVNVRTGTKAAVVTGNGGQKYVGQTLRLRAGVQYTLTGWVKLSGRTSGSATLRYVELSPTTVIRKATDVSINNTWTQVSITFTTSANMTNGRLDLYLNNLNSGATVYFDDVSITQTSGTVPVADTPTGTASQTFNGPGLITLQSPTPGGVIRYTVDGTEPNRYSTVYRGPFELRYSAQIKARTFSDGYQPSGTLTTSYEVNRTLNVPGKVPFYPVNWNHDVETWWQNHPYNPASPSFIAVGSITSPTNVIDVYDVWQANPSSTTAGIQEAINLLPATGGTLYFRDGITFDMTKNTNTSVVDYYQVGGVVLIQRKSNVHFVSADTNGDGRGAVIKGRGDTDMFSFMSLQYTDTGGASGGYQSKGVSNFYFKDLVFDGSSQSTRALFFHHSSEVLIDRCRFENFVDLNKGGHPGTISSNMQSHNIWIRDSYIQGGQNGVYFDGPHGGGIINTTFTGIDETQMLLFTNDDMALWSPRPPSTQYFIAVNNTLNTALRAYNIDGGNSIFADNIINGTVQEGVQINARHSDIIPHLHYVMGNVKVLRNSFNAANTFLVVKSKKLTAATYSDVRDHLIRDNTVAGNVNRFAVFNTVDAGATITNVTIENNFLKHSNLPTVVFEKPGVSGVQVIANDFLGTTRTQIVNNTGSALPAGTITFTGNRDNPTQIDAPVIAPAGGTHVDKVRVVITPIWAGGQTRYTTDGSTPTTSSPLYSGPFVLTGAGVKTVKARTFAAGYTDSPVTTATMTVKQNLVVNGGFELDANGDNKPDNWNVKPESIRDTNESRTGFASTKVSGTTSFNYNSQTLLLPVGKVYTLSLWIKTENVTGAGVRSRYVKSAPTPTQTWQTPAVTGTTDWTQYSVTIDLTGVSSLTGGRVDITWDLGSGGVAWFDDVVITEN